MTVTSSKPYAECCTQEKGKNEEKLSGPGNMGNGTDPQASQWREEEEPLGTAPWCILGGTGRRIKSSGPGLETQ